MTGTDSLYLGYNRRLEETPNHVLYGKIKDLYGDGEGAGKIEVHKEMVAGRKNIPRLVLVAEKSREETEKVLGLEGKDKVVVYEGEADDVL